MLISGLLTTLQLCAILPLEPAAAQAQEIEAQHILGNDFGINVTGAPPSPPLGACHVTCTTLSAALPFQVHHAPFTLSDPVYATFHASYFTTQQREVVPSCIVQPRSAQDVALAVRTIAGADDHHNDGEEKCIFAIKSGGHATFAGASNAPGGVTIDLCNLDQSKVSEDRGTVALGPGARWGDVYEAIERYGVMVVGGRDNSVGVGGFILGGGISFISRRYGWAIDNIRNFEVVLANGSIVEANPVSNPDLYYALRGGGSNFGIVTRFDVETYPRTPMWGGVKVYLLDDISRRRAAMGVQRTFALTPKWLTQKLASGALGLACRLGLCISSDTMIHAFERMVAKWDSDPFAQAFIAIAMIGKVNIWIIIASQVYGKAEAEPAVFKEFKEMPSVYKTTRFANLSELTKELSSGNLAGDRQLWNEFTFRVNSTLMSKLVDIFVAECDPVWKIEGLIPAIDFMIISKDEIKHFSKNGGNAFGLSEEKNPLLLVLVALRWTLATDDAAISAIAENLRTRFIALGKEMGLYHPYVYPNYAYKTEDVVAGYGNASRERLREIMNAYDPKGLFRKKMSGYFRV